MLRALVRTLLVLLCCAWPAAQAADVVEFTNGRYLEVISHRIEGDRVRLDVDRGSFMIIPLGQIDAIQRGREVVYRAGVPDVETAAAGPVRHDLPPRRAEARIAFDSLAAGG